MFATSVTPASRKSLHPLPVPLLKRNQLNYEGDVKTMQNNNLGFNISFDIKTGMPIGVKATPQKAFCKVCHDAGKPENIYTNHFVRAAPTPDAPVVCPTLLAQPCRYCGVAGHTVKYCPNLHTPAPVSRQAPFVPNEDAATPSAKLTKNCDNKITNRFSALSVDDSSDDEETIVVPESAVDEFEEIKSLSLQTLTAMLTSIQVMQPQSNNKLVIAIESAISNKKKVTITTATNMTDTISSKDWADRDDEEINFAEQPPNFPPLSSSTSVAVKPSYAQIAKQ